MLSRIGYGRQKNDILTEVLMLLQKLLSGVKITDVFVPAGADAGEDILSRIDVSGVSTNSKTVRAGDVFICINGEHTDGHLYAEAAVRCGATAIVAMRPMHLEVPVITVENTRVAAAFIWNNRYSSPADGMTVISVTGTNGKTSVTYMLREILRAAGYRCGLIGTVKCMAEDDELQIGGGSELFGAAAAMTTPDPEYLYGTLYEMRLRGMTHVLMEASSHALSQHKLDPINTDIAVFCGLSPEHLDYHGSMENYLSAKAVLFRRADRGIINWDNPYSARLCETVEASYIRVGTVVERRTECDLFADDIVYHRGRVSYRLVGKGTDIGIDCAMPGIFGVYNSMLAAAAALEAGVSPEIISSALGKFPGVEGRMETVASLGGLRVIRDYAHTPEALRAAARIAADETDGRLWLLFGCGGDRDKTKRPEMGRIAAEIADFTVITSDNCRSEDRDDVIADIAAGFDPSKPHIIIPDREEAVRYAVANAGMRDTVLLCGKGHENYEITAEGKRPFDETAIARSAIRERALCMKCRGKNSRKKCSAHKKEG